MQNAQSMRKFTLSIFKGAEPLAIIAEQISASDINELKEKRKAFVAKCRAEHPSLMNNPKVWVGTKRIR